MGEWKEYKIKDLGFVVTGKTPSSTFPEEFGSEMPFVTPTDFRNYRKQVSFAERNLSAKGIEKLRNKVLPPASVLVTCIGSDMGKVVMNRVPVITNQQINAIIPNQELVSPDFLYYMLVDCYETLRMYSQAGTAVPILNKGDFEDIDLIIPSDLPEQKSIASILSSLDDKIDLLHLQNKTLEALAVTLFRQWFLPASAGQAGVEEAEEGWETGTIEDEFDFTMGQSPPGSSYNEDGKGMVFFQGRTDFNFRFPEPRVYTTEPNRLAKKFDTLISVRAPVGDINMAMEECCLGRGVAAFRYKDNPSYHTYTYYKLRSLMAQIKQFEDSGTVFGSIGKDDFNKLENILPSSKLVEKFQAQAAPLDEKIYKNTLQIKTLTRLRDTLLSKLMSGEVKVKNN